MFFYPETNKKEKKIILEKYSKIERISK